MLREWWRALDAWLNPERERLKQIAHENLLRQEMERHHVESPEWTPRQPFSSEQAKRAFPAPKVVKAVPPAITPAANTGADGVAIKTTSCFAGSDGPGVDSASGPVSSEEKP